MMKTFQIVSLSLNLILIGIEILNLSSFHAFAQVTETTNTTRENSTVPVPVLINKCHENVVVQNFLEVPKHLQSMKSPKTVPVFSAAFGSKKFYNFTLVYQSESEFSEEKDECEKKTLEIPLVGLPSPLNQNQNQNQNQSTAKNETQANFLPLFSPFGLLQYKKDFYLNPKNYCVKKMNDTVLTVEICGRASRSTMKIKSDISWTLPKCCRMGRVLIIEEDQITSDCKISVNLPWKPREAEDLKIYPNYHYVTRPYPSPFILPYQMGSGIKRKKISLIAFKDIRVLENGGVETRDSGNHNWRKLEENTYCIDGYYDQLTSEKNKEYEAFHGIPPDSFILFEQIRPASESGRIKDLIFTVTSFISSFVLLIIVIVYALVWNQQNIHGWTSGAFSLAMFLWFLFTGVRHVYQEDDELCKFIAVLTQFFHISVFSWMLVLNFDLWSTISSMTDHSQRSKGHKRFLCYCCVAMAIPTIIVSISLIIENQFSLFDDRVIRPQYGRERCSLDRTAVKAYAIYPTLILFLPNIIFILLTLKIVLDSRKGRKKLHGENSKMTNTHKHNNTEMKLCLKLFAIMGISWIFDIISGLADTDEVSWYWMITDIYNILQPFLLFWLFICKRTIRDQLSKKYTLFKAGFKRMDVHLPPCFSSTKTATGTGSGTEQSESQATKSSAFTVSEGKSAHFPT